MRDSAADVKRYWLSGYSRLHPENGIEKILELNISDEERAKLHESEAAVRKTTAILKELNVL